MPPFLLLLRCAALCILLLAAQAVLPALTAQAHAWQARVVYIADGDTVTVLRGDRQQVRVRLYGIDAPEKGRPYSGKATRALAAMVGNTVVELTPMDVDHYGRLVAVVTPAGEQRSANEQLLALGLARVYRRHCTADFCARWLELEAQARAAQAGMWRRR